MIDLNLILAYLDEEEDEQLLTDIFNTYSKQMMAYAMLFLKNTEDAEDVVGTVFEKIASRCFDAVRKIKSKTDLRNYLLKAIKNNALNLLGEKERMSIPLEEASSFRHFSKEELTDNSFFETFCVNMDYKETIQAINALPEKYRDALYYHFAIGLTVSDVAKLMFQSVSATKQQLVRGKKMLLNMMNKKGDESLGNDKK